MPGIGEKTGRPPHSVIATSWPTMHQSLATGGRAM